MQPDGKDHAFAGRALALSYGVPFLCASLGADNFRRVLAPRLGAGDLLLNLSVDVSSLALIALCQELGALYLDTCIEPWAGGYTDPALSTGERTNYALRQAALALRRKERGGPTAVLTQGAGRVRQHLVGRGLCR